MDRLLLVKGDQSEGQVHDLWGLVKMEVRSCFLKIRKKVHQRNSNIKLFLLKGLITRKISWDNTDN